MTTTEIKIDGQSFNIVDSRLFEYRGHERTEVFIVKPRGRKVFAFVEYENGSRSEVYPTGYVA